MKKILLLLSVTVLFSCKMQITPSKWTDKPSWTKHGFFYEKNRHLTTNYIRGLYVPPGTEVKVTQVKGSRAWLVINGVTVEIVNYDKFTNLDTEGFLDRLLSASPVTPKVSDKYKINLKTGQPSIGMTKDEVITVIGYPPIHQTYSLDQPKWKYWWSRFNAKNLIFENGVLKTIQD